MNENIKYSLLADVFRYPTEGYLDRVNECGMYLLNNYPKAYDSFVPFMEILALKSFHEIEELFGKTFHIQAICYLDLGYTLFAEDYKRGAFLVQMKNEQRKANNDCGVELSDNLPNCLTLIPLLEDKVFKEELVVRMYIPAIKSMLDEFSESKISAKTKARKRKQKVIIQEDMSYKNAYKYAIEALYEVLSLDFDIEKYKEDAVKPDLLNSFLPSCGTCSTESSTTKIVNNG